MSASSINSFAGIVGVGQTLPIALPGEMFYLSVSSAPVFIRSSGGVWSQFQPGTGLEVPQFSQLEVYNGTANPVTFQIFAGPSGFIDNRAIPWLQSPNVVHLVASQDGYGWTTIGDSSKVSVLDLSGQSFQTGQYVNPFASIVGAGGVAATFTLTVTNGLISAIAIATPGSGMTDGLYTTGNGGLKVEDDSGSGASLSVTVSGGVATVASVLFGGNPATTWLAIRRVSLSVQTQNYQVTAFLQQTLSGSALAIIQSVQGTMSSPIQAVSAPFELEAAGNFVVAAVNSTSDAPLTSVWEIYESVAQGFQGTPPN